MKKKYMVNLIIMYYPPPQRGSNSTGVIILLVVAVMCCMFVMPALGFGAWTLFKKDDKEETGDDKEETGDDKDETSGPQLTFDQDATKTINENENMEPADENDDTDETVQVDDSTTSTYKIEYAGGRDGSEFIDLTLNWTNGQGFEDVVNKLIFTRYVKVGSNETSWKKVQADKETTVPSEISDYGSGSIKFKGTEVINDVNTKGVNVVRAYYNEMKADNLLATAELEITEADFDQVMTGEFSELVIPVAISKGSFKLTRTVKKTYYNLSLDAVDQSIKYVSAFTDKKVNGYWYTVKQDGDIFKFIREDGKEVQLGKEKNSEFKIQTYKDGGKILIHAGDCSKASSAALCNKAKGKIYVNEGQDGAYFSVDEMTSDRLNNATFILVSRLASGFPTGRPTDGEISSTPCDIEKAKYCLENLMESTASTSFLATANTAAGNACSIKYNCAPDIWF
jgi:hypothetical protein